MNAAKQCKHRFEDIVAFVMGELDPAAAWELQEHIAVCEGCREARDALTEEEQEVRSGFEALAQASGRSSEPCLGSDNTRQEFVSMYPTTISLKG